MVFSDDFERQDTTNGDIGSNFTLRGPYAGSFPLPVTNFGRIYDGRFVSDINTVVYAEHRFAEGQTHLSAEIAWTADTGSATSSTAALLLSTNTNLVTDMIHIVVTRGFARIELRYAANNYAFEKLATATYPTISADGTPHKVEVNVIGNTVTLSIDGQTVTATHPAFGAMSYPVVAWEIYQPGTNTLDTVSFESVVAARAVLACVATGNDVVVDNGENIGARLDRLVDATRIVITEGQIRLDVSKLPLIENATNADGSEVSLHVTGENLDIDALLTDSRIDKITVWNGSTGTTYDTTSGEAALEGTTTILANGDHRTDRSDYALTEVFSGGLLIKDRMDTADGHILRNLDAGVAVNRYVYDANWKLLEQDNYSNGILTLRMVVDGSVKSFYDGDGDLNYQVTTTPDGSLVRYFGLTGPISSYQDTFVNGERVKVTTYLNTGSMVEKDFDHGVLISKTTYLPNGQISEEVFYGEALVTKTYRDGVISSERSDDPDGHILTSYVDGLISRSLEYDASWRLTEQVNYDAGQPVLTMRKEYSDTIHTQISDQDGLKLEEWIGEGTIVRYYEMGTMVRESHYKSDGEALGIVVLSGNVLRYTGLSDGWQLPAFDSDDVINVPTLGNILPISGDDRVYGFDESDRILIIGEYEVNSGVDTVVMSSFGSLTLVGASVSPDNFIFG